MSEMIMEGIVCLKRHLNPGTLESLNPFLVIPEEE